MRYAGRYDDNIAFADRRLDTIGILLVSEAECRGAVRDGEEFVGGCLRRLVRYVRFFNGNNT